MKPIYKKTFDSPTLKRLNDLVRTEWMKLVCIDLTKDEYKELSNIFNDPGYDKKKFHPKKDNLLYDNVIITIENMNGIDYVNSITPIINKSKSIIKGFF